MTYYPVELPHGIVREGVIFGPLSPIDAKAGTNVRAMTLVDEHGLPIELARSQPTIEFQRSNLCRIGSRLDAYRTAFIRDICKDKSEPATTEDIDKLAAQLLTLRQVFSEDILGTTLSEREVGEALGNVQQIKDLITRESFIDPPLYIARPVDNMNLEQMANEASDDLDAYFELRHGSLDKSLDRNLKPFVDSLRAFPARYAQDATLRYASVNDDLVMKLLSCYGETILYSSWNKEEPLWLMRRSDEDATQSILLDGERYIRTASLSRMEFSLGMQLLTQAAVINDTPVLRGRDSSPARLLFPIELPNGKLTIDDKWNLKAELSFPPYAVVDISNRSHVFLMPGGMTVFDYKLGLQLPTAMRSAVVKADDGGVYRHFFTSGGHVCGFDHSFREASLDRLASMIWENYQLMLSVLTDGLKNDTGYVKIPTIRSELEGTPMTIGDVTFLSRYLPRSEIEAYNRTNKPLHIGDGRSS